MSIKSLNILHQTGKKALNKKPSMSIFKHKKSEESIIRGVFIAYFILLFHVALLGLVGILVLFFTGILNFLPWLMLGGVVMIAGCGYLLLRYLRKKSGSLIKVLGTPEFRGKNIEVRLLGGLASFKVNDSENPATRMLDYDEPSRLLPHGDLPREEKLLQLSEMLENEIITPEEFIKAKKRLFDK
jgi:hypothetical protein